MRLRGYRGTDLPLLSGPWLPGELLGLAPADRPGLAEPATVPAPTDAREELCVLEDTGFARFTELDWVNRRARLEIGLRPGAEDAARAALGAALAYGFRGLNLHRLYGWATPAAGAPVGLLAEAGLAPEAELPEACWLDGRPVARQIWGAVRHG